MPTYGFFFVLFVFVVIVTVMSCLLHSATDRPRELQKHIDRRARMLGDPESDPLRSLTSVGNVPRLNLRAANESVTDANNCGRGPKFLSTSLQHTDADCVRACVNDSAKAFYVNAESVGGYVTENGTMLGPGTYCTIGKRPDCNTRTTVVLMTVNSVVCRPKFPRIAGGPTGNRIVACNNQEINHPRNVLFDRLKNRPYDPRHTTIADEDEKMDDGEYRFVCLFGGKDEYDNAYVQHPYDRFQPLRNYCTSLIKNASPDIELRVDLSTGAFTCYCGDKNATRVSNMYAYKPSSPCTAFSYDDVVVHGKKRKRTIPYRCFHVNSKITDVTKYLPCPPEQFATGASDLATLEMVFSYDENAPIEHPLFEQMSGDRVFINTDLKLVG